MNSKINNLVKSYANVSGYPKIGILRNNIILDGYLIYVNKFEEPEENDQLKFIFGSDNNFCKLMNYYSLSPKITKITGYKLRDIHGNIL